MGAHRLLGFRLGRAAMLWKDREQCSGSISGGTGGTVVMVSGNTSWLSFLSAPPPFLAPLSVHLVQDLGL